MIMQTDNVFRSPEALEVMRSGSGGQMYNLVVTARAAYETDEMTLADMRAIVAASEGPNPLAVVVEDYAQRHADAAILIERLSELQGQASRLFGALEDFTVHMARGSVTRIMEHPPREDLQAMREAVGDTAKYNEIFLSKLSPHLREHAKISPHTGLVEILFLKKQDPLYYPSREEDCEVRELEDKLPDELAAAAPPRPPFILRYDSDGND